MTDIPSTERRDAILDLLTCKAPVFMGLLPRVPESPTLDTVEAAELRAPGYRRALVPAMVATGKWEATRLGGVTNNSNQTWPEVVATFFVIRDKGEDDLWGVLPIKYPRELGPGETLYHSVEIGPQHG